MSTAAMFSRVPLRNTGYCAHTHEDQLTDERAEDR